MNWGKIIRVAILIFNCMIKFSNNRNFSEIEL